MESPANQNADSESDSEVQSQINSTPGSDTEASDHDDAVVAEWKELFQEIARFLCDCERNEGLANYERAEYICEHLENIILTVRRLHTCMTVLSVKQQGICWTS